MVTGIFEDVVIRQVLLNVGARPPNDLSPERREKYDRSGRNSKVLVKKLKVAG